MGAKIIVNSLLSKVDIAGLLVKGKFYTSICLGTTAILSVFAFLFLLPFVVDPAFKTIMADFEPAPVTCVAVEHVYAVGLSNCSWASCREGCTTSVLRCHKILVNYTKTPFEEWKKGRVDLETVEWDVGETRFFINTEGCGYPPRVNCTQFSRKYGYTTLGTPFPCFYSRTDPRMVVARYSWDETLHQLILSILLPILIFLTSIMILVRWYCPTCFFRSARAPLDTTSYVESFHSKHEEEEDDDDFEEEEY